MFPAAMIADAARLLAAYRAKGLRITAAESCTGGLICALLTEVAGSSDVVDRGFVTYSNAAKQRMLGVPHAMLAAHGAVSEAVACAMAAGALANADAHVAISVTGIAGPGGGSLAKPVGLVHFGLACLGKPTQHLEHRFGDIGRDAIRMRSVEAAIGLLWQAVRSES